MKSVKYILISALSVLLVSSCGKMLDEIAPKGAISTEDLSDGDIALLSNGVMHQFEAIVSNLWFEGDFLAENFTGGPGFTIADPHSDTQSASSSTALSRWTYCYGKLQYANLLLDAAQGNTSVNAKKALATGHFFRAYIYFNLVTRYGGVPIIKTPTNLDNSVPRASEAEVWNFIREDLKAAETYMAGMAYEGYAYVSIEAIKTLGAKVDLWCGDYTNAISKADDVIASSAGFALTNTSASWAEMFIFGNKSSEVIFAPVNIRNKDYIRIYEKVNDTDGSFNYSADPAIYSGLFVDATEKSGDIRAVATFGDDKTRVIKFPNGQGGQYIKNEKPSESPLLVFRLADVYAIKAEAQWLGGSLNNAKATLKTWMDARYNSVDLSAVTTDEAFEAVLLDEYQREFFAEGRRWFDIKRLSIRRHGYVDANNYQSGNFTTWIKAIYPGQTGYAVDGWNDRHQLMYWPIPQAQRDQSYGALTQNPGYEQ